MVRVADEILDVRNLICPMPVIRTQQRVVQLDCGQVLMVRCTDPGALFDIPAWCRINGHKVISTETKDDEFIVQLKVGNE